MHEGLVGDGGVGVKVELEVCRGNTHDHTALMRGFEARGAAPLCVPWKEVSGGAECLLGS